MLKIPSAQGTSDEPKPADSPKTAEPAVVTADFKVGVQNPQPEVKSTAATTVKTSVTPVEIESRGEEPSDGDYTSMLTFFDTKVSVSFANASLLDVLTAFAQSLGYNIIYKGDSTTKITLSMKDVTLGEALDYILKLNDLSYIVKDNTIIV